MSCFICSDSLFSGLTKFLYREEFKKLSRQASYLDLSSLKGIAPVLETDPEYIDWNKFRLDLFNLNKDAFEYRYDTKIEGVPSFSSLASVENVGFLEANYKRIKCWLYQCSEGNFNETPLWEAMEKIKNELAIMIANKVSEPFPWGE
jgi:hypothetical protein